MTNMLILAVKEVRDGYRNRWIMSMTAIMAILAFALALLGSAPVGSTNISPLAVTVVSLSSLSIFFIPLIALLLSYDGVVGEEERGTLTLLLAYPITRSAIAIGKFAGQLFILAFAIVIGYSGATLAIVISGEGAVLEQQWGMFFNLLISSIMLGAVFLSIGMLISIWAKERATAAACAIGIWLLFVVLYDMALLGVLGVSGAELLNDNMVKWIMLGNPADAYRMFNLTSHSETAVLSGMAGLRNDQGVPGTVLLLLLSSWIAWPLIISCLLFHRRPV